jgi:hypothetical protein
MLDTLVPARDAVRKGLERGPLPDALDAMVAAAEAGAASTTPLVARKGRASYLGERSAGHLDPGAASSALLVRCLAEVLRGWPGTGATRAGSVTRPTRALDPDQRIRMANRRTLQGRGRPTAREVSYVREANAQRLGSQRMEG